MKLYIKTFGCQMNVHDSERIEEILSKHGYEPVDKPELADVALINSCTVREKPWHKAISEAGRLRKRKAKTEDVIIGVVGCVAQQEGERIFKLLPGVDLVVAPDSYGQLPQLISEVISERKPKAVVGFDQGRPEDFLDTTTPHKKDNIATFVTIMKGCEEKCLYCIVPYVRGPERARPAEQIVSEVEAFVKAGGKEVTLLGQKVNAYQHEGTSFVDLLGRLNDISGLERLRFTSPHPRHMPPELTGLYGNLSKLCESIHLPLQSGSTRTLKRMRRRYTAEEYLDVVHRLRTACPQMAISTDIIVGYPGETDADFQETLSVIDKVQFSKAFSFKYSPRPGTPAEKLEDDVTPEVKTQRLNAVHEKMAEIETRWRKSFIGKKVEILIEGKGRMPGQFSGRARNNQVVNFTYPPGDNGLAGRVGQLVQVEITAANPNSLEGIVAK